MSGSDHGERAEQGFVTILFTDIVGSTALFQERGDEAADRLRRAHFAVLRGAVDQHGGREVKSLGDGLMVAFPSAVAAVRCAVAMQQATSGARDGLDLRVGLDAGEPVPEADDLYGTPVIVASRLCDAAEGGEILASDLVCRIASPRIAEPIRPVGALELRGIDEPVSAARVCWRGPTAPEEIPPRRRAPRVEAAPGVLERERELHELDSLIGDATEGAGRLLLIEGPAGIGKTRLLRELRRLGASRRLRALSARAGELERDFGFGVVRQLLEPASGTEDRGPLFEGAAGLAEPVFASAPDATQPDSTHAVMHGLYWLVVNLAETRPLVMIVDDVQWSDLPSVRFLIHLARRLDGLPVALAVASRMGDPGADHELQRELRVEARPPILRPAALSAEATGRVVSQALDREVSGDLRAACHETSGGNPFLLTELIAELRAEISSGREPSQDLVRKLGPERIAATLLLRLGRVDPDAPALTRAVAVLGTRTPAEDAAALAGLDAVHARVLAGHLAQAGVLDYADPLDFVHPIMRTAIYEDIAPAERARMHASAAELLSRRHAEAQTIALHLLASLPAADPDVVATLRAAATEARARGAPETAVRYLRRALAEPPQPELRNELLLELGLAADHAGEPEAIARLREAYDAADSPERRATAGFELARVVGLRGSSAEATRVRAEALEALGDVDSPVRWPLEASLLFGVAHSSERTQARVRTQLDRIEAQFDRIPSAAKRLVTAVLAEERAISGDRADVAAELAHQALGHGALLKQVGPLIPFVQIACSGLIYAGRFAEAEREEDRAVAAAQRLGSQFWAASHMTVRALARLRQGSLRDAESDAELALDVVGLNVWQVSHNFILAVLVSVRVARGQLDSAQALLDSFAPLTPLESDLFQLVREARIGLLLARGDASAALEEAHRCAAWDASRTPPRRPGNGLAPVAWRSLAATALARLGEVDEATKLAGEEVERARRYGDPCKLGVALRTLGEIEGGERGIELLAHAAEVLEPSPARLEYGRAVIELGSARRRAGCQKEARADLMLGMDLAHRCGADALVERARDELLRAGARPRRRALSGIDALTPSERRVAEMAADDMTNKQIAQSLFVTLRTVEMHLSNAYAKLGIQSRNQLSGALQP